MNVGFYSYLGAAAGFGVLSLLLAFSWRNSKQAKLLTGVAIISTVWACLAALGIQQALRGYGQSLRAGEGIDFKMRLGLNSGPVVISSIGDDLRMDYTAIGDTTNLAARMESMAQPATTLISEHTHKIVSPYFQCKSMGRISVKGKEEPVGTYRLEAKQEVYRPRLGLERQIYSEMVGRDTELGRLEHQISKAVRGEGSIVNIIGEAGIGKSRLVAELKTHDVIKKVALLEGRANNNIMRNYIMAIFL